MRRGIREKIRHLSPSVQVCKHQARLEQHYNRRAKQPAFATATIFLLLKKVLQTNSTCNQILAPELDFHWADKDSKSKYYLPLLRYSGFAHRWDPREVPGLFLLIQTYFSPELLHRSISFARAKWNYIQFPGEVFPEIFHPAISTPAD